jgi:hypothetical protein
MVALLHQQARGLLVAERRSRKKNRIEDCSPADSQRLQMGEIDGRKKQKPA